MSKISNEKQKYQVFEIRRFHFRSFFDLRPIIPCEELPGGEYKVHPSRYETAVHQLKQNRDLDVQTVRDQYNLLNWLNYREVRTSPRWITVDDTNHWAYLSPITRRWRRCLSRGKQILARPGWTLCHHRENGRREFFLFEENTPLDACRQKGDQAILLGYEGVLGTLPVPIWESDQFIYAIWPGYVIPKEHEKFLTQTISPLNIPLASDEGESVWVWHVSDRDFLEHIFRGLHLRLEKWSVNSDWTATTSLIIRRAYGNYLKRRDGAESLRELIRRRAWDEITDEQLSNVIRQLCYTEWNGNSIATTLLNFVSDNLSLDLDWHDYGKVLEGWVIESSPINFGTYYQDKRYHRVTIPKYDIVVGWETIREADWDTNLHPRVQLSHWRCAPYIGRLKTAPRSDDPVLGQAGRTLQRSAYRTMLGLPSIEWQLAKELKIGAFVLDLDGTHWRGCNDLCRYFSAYGRVLKLNPAECDGYGVFFEDILGSRFALETHALNPDQIPAVGDWFFFIALSSLLRHNTWLSLQRDIPVFELKHEQSFRRAYQSEALQNGLLATIKYHFGLSQQQLWEAFMPKWSSDELLEATKILIEREEVVEFRRKLYYRYTSLSSAEMKNLIEAELRGMESQQPFAILRSLLHPLSIRSVDLKESEVSDISDFNRTPTIFMSRDKSDQILFDQAQNYLQSSGQIRICGRGHQVDRAKVLIKNLYSNYAMLQIRRNDSTHTFPDGNVVPEVVYALRDSLRLLQKRFGG